MLRSDSLYPVAAAVSVGVCVGLSLWLSWWFVVPVLGFAVVWNVYHFVYWGHFDGDSPPPVPPNDFVMRNELMRKCKQSGNHEAAKRIKRAYWRSRGLSWLSWL